MTDRISQIKIDEAGLVLPTPEIEQERRVAIFDLLEQNHFALPAREGRVAVPGPYHLALGIREGRLVVDVSSAAGEKAGEFHLSLGPFRQIVKDYHQICDSYFDAVKRLAPAQIEAIDMARASGGEGFVRQRHSAAAVHADLRAAMGAIG
jgi:uncharacterized protein (UPF0262 family)